MFISIKPEQLDTYMLTHNVKDYLLIDVRQPGEYEQGHIPGAKLIPIMRLVANLYDLPPDRDLIFYCRNDGRSMAAATLALEEKINHKQIYHLTGGIMAYDGKIQSDKPKLKLFESGNNISDQLKIAMDMEKGALKFYTYLTKQFQMKPCGHIFAKLSQAEQNHIRSIYQFWISLRKTDLSFEVCLEQLPGEILEGGNDRLKLQRKIAAANHDACITAIEISLEIEYCAFDLYRNLAETLNDQKAQQLFWDLAQSEKGHIQQLTQAAG